MSSETIKQVDLTSFCQKLKNLYRRLIRFSHVLNPDDLNNTLLSKGFILEVAASIGIVSGKYIPRTRGVDKEPWIAQVQLEGQPAVMSSQ